MTKFLDDLLKGQSNGTDPIPEEPASHLRRSQRGPHPRNIADYVSLPDSLPDDSSKERECYHTRELE